MADVWMNQKYDRNDWWNMKKERRERNFRILEFRENQYDIIGDVHGCYEELIQLVEQLGYRKENGIYIHPQKRRLISVGDVADKGPANVACLNFWMDQVMANGGFWVSLFFRKSCTSFPWSGMYGCRIGANEQRRTA